MFKNPFSFNGIIHRTEYFISMTIFIVYVMALPFLIYALDPFNSVYTYLYLLTFIPLILFKIAQSTKRCHDLGESGWRQLIPLYFLVLFFAKK